MKRFCLIAAIGAAMACSAPASAAPAASAPFAGLYAGAESGLVYGKQVSADSQGYDNSKATSGYLAGATLTEYAPFDVYGIGFVGVGAFSADFGAVGYRTTYSYPWDTETDAHSVTAAFSAHVGIGKPFKLFGIDFLADALAGPSVTLGNDASTYTDSTGTYRYVNSAVGIDPLAWTLGLSAKMSEHIVATLSYANAVSQTAHESSTGTGSPAYRYRADDSLHVLALGLQIKV